MKKKNIIRKTILLLIITMLFSVYNPLMAAQSGETVIASFDIRLPEDTTSWVNQGVVYLHKSKVNAIETRNNSDAIAIRFWSGNGTIMRIGISEPLVTGTLQTRKDFLVEDIIDSLLLKIEITKQTDGKYMMFVNDVPVNEINWLSKDIPEGYTESTWKETDNLLRTSDLSKIPTDSPVYIANDNAKIDFLSALPDVIEMTLDSASMPFKVENVSLLGSKTSSPDSLNTSKITSALSVNSSTESGGNASDTDNSKTSSVNDGSTEENPIFSSGMMIIVGAIILIVLICVLIIIFRKKKLE